MNSLTSTVTIGGFDGRLFVEAALVVLIASLILGFLGRFAFGKKSVLNRSVSAAIGILFIYAATVVIYSTGVPLERLLSPLPFVHIVDETLVIFTFQGTAFSAVCSELLSMVILAFLVNLLDTWIPEGKNLLTWIFFRCVTIVGAMALHVLVNWLLTRFLPEGLLAYAPTVLLCILVVMLLTGALKLMVGVAIASVNPIIGALYTFFFATLVGKQLSKAVLTTLILAALVFALNKLGVTVISIAGAALMAYIPLLLLLLAVWYLVRKVL